MTAEERAEIVAQVKMELAAEREHERKVRSVVNLAFSGFRGDIAVLEGNGRRRIEPAIRQLLIAAYKVHSLERIAPESENGIREFIAKVLELMKGLRVDQVL